MLQYLPAAWQLMSRACAEVADDHLTLAINGFYNAAFAYEFVKNCHTADDTAAILAMERLAKFAKQAAVQTTIARLRYADTNAKFTVLESGMVLHG